MTKRVLWIVPVVAVLAALVWIRASSQGALLTNAELRRLGTSDNTAAAHRRLAAHYRAHAAEHTADAAIHVDIANSARPRKGDDDAWDLARDASHYAEHSSEAAEALNELATLHEEMAKRSK